MKTIRASSFRMVVETVVAALFATVAVADNVWLGNSSDWNAAGNWSSTAVPTSTDNQNVLIPAGRDHYPVLASDVVVDGRLTIEQGASLALVDFDLSLVDVTDDTKGIQIEGELSASTNSLIAIRRGNFINVGTVVGQPAVKIGGYNFGNTLSVSLESSGAVLSGLTLERTSGYTVTLSVIDDTVVSGDLTINGGTLTVQAAQTLTVSNNLVFGKAAGMGSMYLYGDVMLSGTIISANTNAYCNGLYSGWVNLVGGGDQVISNATGYLPPIKVDKPYGALKVVGDLNCGGLQICTNNTVVFEPGRTLTFGGASTCAGARGVDNYGTIENPPPLIYGVYAYNSKLRSGGVTFPSLTLLNTENVSFGPTLSDDVAIAGDVRLMGSGSLSLSTRTLMIGGSFFQETNGNTRLAWSSSACVVFTSSVPATVCSGGTYVNKTFPNLVVNKPGSYLMVTNTPLLVEGDLTIQAGELRPSINAEIWLGAKRWGYPLCIADVGLKTSAVLTTNSFSIAGGAEIPLETDLYNIAPYAALRTSPYGTLAWRMTDTDNPTNLGTATQLESPSSSYQHYEFRFSSAQPVAAIRYCQRLPRFALSADTTGDGNYDTLVGIQDAPTNGILSVWVGREWFETRFWPTFPVYGIRMDVLETSGAGIYDFQILSTSSNLVTTETLEDNVAVAQEGDSVAVPDPRPDQRFTQGFHCEPWMFGSQSFFPSGTNAPPSPSTWSSYAPLLNLINSVKTYHANMLWIFPPVTFMPVRGPGLYEYDDLWPSTVSKWSTAENHLEAIADVMHTNGLSVFVQDRAPHFIDYTGTNADYYAGPIVSQWYRDTFSTFVAEQAGSGIDGSGVCLDEQNAWQGSGSLTAAVNTNAFVARFGINPPTAAGDTEAYRKWIIFCYEQVGALHAQAVQAAKAANPSVRTLSNSTVCESWANNRYGNSCAAYDITGHASGMDMFGTDPYHTQDDGDLAHYRCAAYTKRLIAATTNRQSLVTLNCPWANSPTTYPAFYWHFPPVSMNGPVISSAMHGGQAFAYWRWNFIFYGGYDTYVKQGFEILDTLAAWGAKSAHVPRDIAVLKSRASEDWWQVKVQYHSSTSDYLDQFKGYFNEKWLLEFLFMNGYPFEMYYQDQTQDYKNNLAKFKLVILPFSYSMSQEAYAAIATAANSGTRFIAFAGQGEVDEYGTAHAEPLLADLIAQGKVTLMTNDVAKVGQDTSFLNSMRTLVDDRLGDRKPIYLNRYGNDVEAGCLEKSDTEKFLFLINWAHHPVTVDAGIRMAEGKTYKVLCRDLNGTAETTIGGASEVAATNLWKFRVSLDTDEIKVFHVSETTNNALQSCLWIGEGGDWSEPSNWVNGAVPAAGDLVAVTNAGASVVLSESTPLLGSFTVGSGASLVFSNWNTRLQANNVTIQSGGTVTHAGPFTDAQMSNNVTIVCGNLTVDAGGSINVNARGYAGGGASKTSPVGDGFGPGRGLGEIYGLGAGHGGRGGGDVNKDPNYEYPGKYTYDSLTIPLTPGSGGGGSDGAANGGKTLGGAGGGAVRIEADGAVVVNGIISANGTNGSGGGAGGSVYIHCNTFDGTNGLVTANGGTGHTANGGGGQGGGGRIAVDYNTSAQTAVPNVTFQVKPGYMNTFFSACATRGDMGTLHFTDSKFFTATITNIAGQVWGFNSLAFDTLTVSNTWVRFAEDGFQLRVTNNLTVTGSSGMLQVGGSTNLYVYQADPRYASTTTEYWYGPTPAGISVPPVVDIGGSLILTNSGAFAIYSAPTNGATDYGALVSVSNDIQIAANSYLYPYSHPTNGAGVRLRLRDLTIATGGGVNGTGKGYAGGVGMIFNGFGPGGGAGSYYPAGGGNGGNGGDSFYAGFGGDSYGSATNPATAGSGGGGQEVFGHPADPHTPGGPGGSMIWIDADRDVTVYGAVEANGGPTSCSGGAGGSVRIQCQRVLGSGAVRANGATASAHFGAGGGGRIALLYDKALQTTATTLQLQAAGGAYAGHPGGMGTIYLPNTLFLASPIQNIVGQLVEIPSLSYATLTVSNAAVRFPAEGFHLTVTNDLYIVGANTELGLGGSVVHRLYTPVYYASQVYTRKRILSGATVPVQLDVGGNLTLASGADLYVYSAATNGTTGYGALVTVDSDVLIASNSFIYPQSHPTNGGSVHFFVKNMTVDAGGGIDAVGRGFSSASTATYAATYGPGAGHSSSYPDGAGYGGHGGNNIYGNGGGGTYGSSSAPTLPGSGGGGHATSSTSFGSAGGGLIWVEAAKDISLSGRLSADSTVTNLGYNGAGSGGGIYIKCKTLRGNNGALSARGADATDTYNGAGGGGRIAIWRMADAWTGLTATAAAGTTRGTYTPLATDGTVFWGQIPPLGTGIFFR